MADKKVLTVDSDGSMMGADVDGDGHITETELSMHLEFKRKELEDGMVCSLRYVVVSVRSCACISCRFVRSNEYIRFNGTHILCISCRDSCRILCEGSNGYEEVRWRLYHGVVLPE